MDTQASQVHDLTRVLNRALNGSAAREPDRTDPRTWRPLFDVKETETEFVVYADLPGIDEDELHFDIEDGVLRITGMREFDHDIEDAEEFIRLERPYGAFRCSIPLTQAADLDYATAKYKRGVLKVRLPKHRAKKDAPAI